MPQRCSITPGKRSTKVCNRYILRQNPSKVKRLHPTKWGRKFRSKSLNKDCCASYFLKTRQTGPDGNALPRAFQNVHSQFLCRLYTNTTSSSSSQLNAHLFHSTFPHFVSRSLSQSQHLLVFHIFTGFSPSREPVLRYGAILALARFGASILTSAHIGITGISRGCTWQKHYGKLFCATLQLASNLVFVECNSLYDTKSY